MTRYCLTWGFPCAGATLLCLLSLICVRSHGCSAAAATSAIVGYLALVLVALTIALHMTATFMTAFSSTDVANVRTTALGQLRLKLQSVSIVPAVPGTGYHAYRAVLIALPSLAAHVNGLKQSVRDGALTPGSVDFDHHVAEMRHEFPAYSRLYALSLTVFIGRRTGLNLGCVVPRRVSALSAR